jgi:hypothetical protein
MGKKVLSPDAVFGRGCYGGVDIYLAGKKEKDRKESG